MNGHNEQANTDFDESKVVSYFPQLFVAKLAAYMQGEPSAYIGGRVVYDTNNPQSGTIFQGKINKAVAAANSPGTESIGIDISRMFDEIDLAGDFLELEKQGQSEYRLIQDNLDYAEQRVHYILQHVANEMLNESRTELSSSIQDLLNKVLPGGYLGLLNQFKPGDRNLPNFESMSAEEIEQAKLTIAKQRLAYAFMDSVKACYAQKLLDLNEQKFPKEGWDMDVKSFADESELSEHVFPEKLTAIRVGSGDTEKFYVYGNGDGSEWRLREVKASTFPDVNFDFDDSIPSTRRYKMTQDQIRISGAHNLSEGQQALNAQNDESYLRYYFQVVTPLQVINQKPLTDDSFFVSTEGVKSTDELLIDLDQKKGVINARLDDLLRYRDNIQEPTILQIINQQIRLYEDKEGAIEKVDFLLGEENVNPRQNIIEALDDTNESEEVLAAIDSYVYLQTFAARVRRDIREEAIKEDDENIETASVSSQNSLGQQRAKTLLDMIEKEQAQIRQDLEDNQLNITQYNQSPAYLLAVMQKAYSDLTIMARHIDSYSANADVGDAQTLDILAEVRKFAMLEQEIIDANAGIEDTEEAAIVIEKAQQFVNSPITALASKFSEALQTNNTQQMLSVSRDLESLPTREMIKLKIIGLQTKIQDDKKRYANILKQIESDLDFLEIATAEQVVEYSESSSVYAVANDIYALQNLSSNHFIQKARLKMEVSSSLHNLESAYFDSKISASLDELIKYVAVNYKSQQEDAESGADLIQEKANLSKMIIDTRNNFESSDPLAKSRARRSQIVEVAARYAKVMEMDEETKPAELARVEQSLEALVAPKPAPVASPKVHGTGMFRKMFQGIVSPSKESSPGQNETPDTQEDPDADDKGPNMRGKF